ncbi:hypothetical protein ACFQZS_18000 [Mucilaginibacter calamicampi]|uniref:Restriction endonuclease n=1 Tax=Mucilaginibacter calamicampi TaxID=1302352 RepID=A0ABW2Z1U7_9SPHI
MPISGTDFEELVKPFFKTLFNEMGFTVIQVRKQNSGTQNGFDISILFLDGNEQKREIFIECKYYTTVALDWSEIFAKQIQLEASNHVPTAFIALSPLRNLSNIDHNIQAKATKMFRCPVEFWTPDKDIENMFALDEDVYKKVFNKAKCDVIVDKEKEVKRIKAMVDLLIQQKDILDYSNVIRIAESDKQPSEDQNLVTTLDEKLNAIFEDSDPNRISYHKTRADYKVYLESLVDVNSDLRQNILNWEENMRLKAARLTHNFVLDDTYTPQKFFHDFFIEAEKEILSFYKDWELKGDKDKLLHGLVFELAAQCPLDWRKNGAN